MRARLVPLLLTVVLTACSSNVSEQTSDDPTPQLDRLDGSYSAIIGNKELKKKAPDLPRAFAGEYELRFDDGLYYLSSDRFGRISETVLAITEDEIRFKTVPAPEGAFNCTSEETAVYSYELTEDSLSLEAVEEPCVFRTTLLERTWAVEAS